MADQKEMKKRLKALMNRPENHVCSDCPEKQPRWASLIKPPPGCPNGSLPIGAFICLECSGSHRQLGVHLVFVRSINLDSWKEKEVQAMENGGNYKVNKLFEARLAGSGVQKPSNLADGPTRERFIRDKYERRKFYDPSVFATLETEAAQQQKQQEAASASSDANRIGAPSNAAAKRVEERRAARSRKPPSRNNSFEEKPVRPNSHTTPSKTKIHHLPHQQLPRIGGGNNHGKAAAAAAAAPPPAPTPAAADVDLLDLSSPAPAAAAATTSRPARASPHDAPNRSTYVDSMTKADVDLFSFMTVNNSSIPADFHSGTPQQQQQQQTTTTQEQQSQRTFSHIDESKPPQRMGGNRDSYSRESFSSVDAFASFNAPEFTIDRQKNNSNIMSLYGDNNRGSMPQIPMTVSARSSVAGMNVGPAAHNTSRGSIRLPTGGGNNNNNMMGGNMNPGNGGNNMAAMAAMMQQMNMNSPTNSNQMTPQQQQQQQMMMMQQQQMMMMQGQMQQQQQQQQFQNSDMMMAMMRRSHMNGGNMMQIPMMIPQQVGGAMPGYGGGGVGGAGGNGHGVVPMGSGPPMSQFFAGPAATHHGGGGAGGAGGKNKAPAEKADPFAQLGMK